MPAERIGFLVGLLDFYHAQERQTCDGLRLVPAAGQTIAASPTGYLPYSTGDWFMSGVEASLTGRLTAAGRTSVHSCCDAQAIHWISGLPAGLVRQYERFDMRSLHARRPLLIETRASLNEPALRRRGIEDQAVFMRAHRFGKCPKRVLRTTVVVPVMIGLEAVSFHVIVAHRDVGAGQTISLCFSGNEPKIAYLRATLR
ncbi:hypothetical protein BJY52DRAFT_832642 [Lactarius psammicola]|nr:hypothetical protein BJY52DRAFT_832642 [Lactarius psammicola]